MANEIRSAGMRGGGLGKTKKKKKKKKGRQDHHVLKRKGGGAVFAKSRGTQKKKKVIKVRKKTNGSGGLTGEGWPKITKETSWQWCKTPYKFLGEGGVSEKSGEAKKKQNRLPSRKGRARARGKGERLFFGRNNTRTRRLGKTKMGEKRRVVLSLLEGGRRVPAKKKKTF